MRGLQLRVENMERQHQQTMSFLSKALQNPGFLQQILQARGASQIAGDDSLLFIIFCIDFDGLRALKDSALCFTKLEVHNISL